ncbi:MAG: hypothetical protein ACYC6M_05865 [Terriglobales bacterium]
MSKLSRRRLGSLAGSMALGAWAAPALSRADVASAAPSAVTDAATPLTPSQMEQYRKTLPDHAKSLGHLHQFPLPYDLGPAFIFRAPVESKS